MEQRDRLREQAATQLEKLQSMEGRVSPPAQAALSHKPPPPPLQAGAAADGSSLSALPPQTAAPAIPADAARSGYLSLDLDLAPVGIAYHFGKLHGDPHLVLQVHHVDRDRRLAAILWAGVCLGWRSSSYDTCDALTLPPWWRTVGPGWLWSSVWSGCSSSPQASLDSRSAMIAAWVLVARAARPPANVATPPQSQPGT